MTIDRTRRSPVRRPVAALFVAALLMPACSDGSLSALGDRSSDWIGEVAAEEGEQAYTAQPIDAPDALEWSNDDLGVPASADPAEVITAVVERSTGGDRFVQASRFEIARALPEVSFPNRIPTEVDAVTSQLVVSIGGDRLDDEVFATFGLWTVEPYTKSRSVGQRGVLSIGPHSEDPPCGRLAEAAQAACSEVDLDGMRASRLDGESGQTWVWTDGVYEYRMFLRGSLEANQPAVEAMTSSLVALGELPVDDDVRVLGTQVSSEG